MMRHVGNHPRPTFAVRTRVPPLAGRQLARLPEQLQVAHADYLSSAVAPLSLRG